MGVVTCWDLTKQVVALGLQPLRGDRVIPTLGNYDPGRRIHRDMLKSNTNAYV